VLLGATFDRVWFKREVLPELIEACEWFLREHIQKPHPVKNYKTGGMEDGYYDSRTLAGDGTESVHKSIGIIKALKQIYEDPTARGAAFTCCSAVSDYWHVQDVPWTAENEDGSIVHSKDEDCAGHIKDDECEVCGVSHSDPCDECKGTGFHKPECDNYEWDSRPWNIDKDKVQPSGEYKGKSAWELTEGLKNPEISLP
jgi:hypothetical protein